MPTQKMLHANVLWHRKHEKHINCLSQLATKETNNISQFLEKSRLQYLQP